VRKQMEAVDSPAASTQAIRPLHVVFGSGGTKAVLAGAGAALAFNISGLHNWETVGAASGGSIPAAVLAAGLPPRQFLRTLLETDIESLLKPNTGFLGRLLAILRKYHFEQNRPRRGAYSSKDLRRFINALLPQWPASFWTVASCSHGQVLFTASGVYKYARDNPAAERLRPRPPSVGLAICASCAIPGVIDSVKFSGELLYDGALSGDGEVPIDVIARHFGHNSALTIAIDIGPEPIKQRRWLRFLWNVFCGGTCETDIDGVHPVARDGLLLVKPVIEGFHALQFRLSRDQKWQAVIAGFLATASALIANNLVDAAAKARLEHVTQNFETLNSLRTDKKLFTRRVEAFMRDNDLFSEEP
jgi:predicted acylesterase/phospholipase RssA